MACGFLRNIDTSIFAEDIGKVCFNLTNIKKDTDKYTDKPVNMNTQPVNLNQLVTMV